MAAIRSGPAASRPRARPWSLMCLTALVAATAPVRAAFPDDSILASDASAEEHAAHCEAASARAAAGASDERASAELRQLAAANSLYQNVHPRRELRDAARACQARIDALLGAPASSPSRASIAASRTQTRLGELERLFEQRLTEHTPHLAFDAADLKGFPPDWLGSLQRPGSTRVEIGIGLAEYYPFMRAVHSEAARRRMYLAHANRGGTANVETLQRIVDLRRTLARERRAPSYYALVAGEAGWPTQAEAARFLDELQPTVQRAADADLRELRARKASLAARAMPGVREARLHRWDALYLIEQARAEFIGQTEADEAGLTPTRALIPWATAYFSRLAGVRFTPRPGTAWHADVQCLHVSDAADGRSRGVLCLDLFPREGKYYNYASFDVPARTASGERLAAVVANIEDAQASPDEVERVFAEFSIALGLLLRAPSADASPSDDTPLWQQMQRAFFEQAAFTDEAQQLLASMTPAVPPKPRPVLEAIRANRYFAAGMTASRQWMVSRFDFLLATAPQRVDVMRAWRALEDATGLPYEPGSYFPSRLNTIAGSGAGTFYTVLWREAASIDLLRQFGEHTLDGASAMRLRQAFFAPPKATAKAGSFAERYRALSGRDMALQPYLDLINDHTIAAAARRHAAQPTAGRVAQGVR